MLEADDELRIHRLQELDLVRHLVTFCWLGRDTLRVGGGSVHGGASCLLIQADLAVGDLDGQL